MEEDVGFGKLDNNIIANYDFGESKKKIDEIMLKVEEYRYRIQSIQPPRITPDYEVKYESQSSRNVSSKVENYVIRKIDIELEASDLYETLSKALKQLNKNELSYFKEYYYTKLSETQICSKYFMSKDKLRIIKESCILKIAMAFGVAIHK